MIWKFYSRVTKPLLQIKLLLEEQEREDEGAREGQEGGREGEKDRGKQQENETAEGKKALWSGSSLPCQTISCAEEKEAEAEERQCW